MEVEICTANLVVCSTENKYICPKAISNKLDQSIAKIVEKTGFTKYDIEKKPVCTNGGNYLGLLYEVDIKGKTKEGDKELNLFVKSVVPGESDLQIVSVSNIYKTELFTYKELWHIFQKLQDEARIPIDERYKMVKSYDESDTEIIIMENVSKKGFTAGHRMDVVTINYAEMAIQALAKFHALSLVIKEKRPVFFEEQVKPMKAAYINDEQWHGFVQSMTNIAINNIDKDIKTRIEKFTEGVAERYGKLYDDEAIKRCLCHGDYRPNNILTKTINGKVSEIIPVDYQLLHFGCPVIDILYFIFSCTDKEFRRDHMSHLKDLYYDSMAKFLKYFDMDVNLYYPRSEFEKEYKNNLYFGLMFSLVFLGLVFVSEDDIPDLTKHEMNSLCFKVDAKYKDRIQGIVEDYIERGII